MITRRRILIHTLMHRRNAFGLCKALRNSIYEFLVIRGASEKKTLDPQFYFPKFTKKNAEKFGADTNETYWWECNTWCLFGGRTRFLLWLIKEYWTDKTDVDTIQ